MEDAAGRVIRHLVAGVLGENPPPPLKAGSLRQEILWDGRDDLGQPVPAGREVARLTVRRTRWGIIPTRRPVVALDDGADTPIVWLSWPFLRIEDRGEEVFVSRDLRSPEWPGGRAMAAVMELSYDRRRRLLYVNNRRRYDLRTGRFEEFRMPGGRMWPMSNPGSSSGSVGRDGNYYVHLGARGAYVYRFGPDLKPIPFPEADDKEGKGRIHGYCRNRSRGHTADAFGNVYVLWKKCPNDPGDATAPTVSTSTHPTVAF